MATSDAQQKTLLDAQPTTDPIAIRRPDAYLGPYAQAVEDSFVVAESQLWFDDATALSDWFAEDLDRLLGDA